MALTVISRPRFIIPSTTGQSVTITASGGLALFTLTGHGLTTNDHIYIYSNLSAYNGEWRATVLTANTFNIKRYPTGIADQAFVNSGTATVYRSMGINNWNCVHLPMVYIMTSDRWPINTVDTARTVSSFSNSNGYTQILLSGDLKASGSASALEQVKISGTPLLDGVYRILTWNSDINVVIDLTYSASNIFTGGTVQYYYGNYHARIRVYAGLPVGHYWRDQKPYELVAEFSQQPDASGFVRFNINEFLKKQIGILENNLLLDTLPNNLDAFCSAYITVAESYDDSNQYGTNDLNVTEFVSAYVSDVDFTIRAINAILPFKTASSGLMNGYVYRAGAAKIQFLTNFTQPTLFVGKYFDLSFIVDDSEMAGFYMLRRVKNASGTILNEFVDAIPDRDFGVYRYSVSQSAYLETIIELTLFNSTYAREVQLSETLTINVDDTCSAQDFYTTWLNHKGGFDYWNFKAETSYATNITQSQTQVKNIFPSWPNSYGEFADSIEKQTIRVSREQITLNSQYLTSDELSGLEWIVSSPLVQQLTSIYDKRTIIIDASTFPERTDNQKLLMATITARYTDDKPAQSL